MSWWLSLALLAVFILLLAAMPWKRPHPNHVFTVENARTAIGLGGDMRT